MTGLRMSSYLWHMWPRAVGLIVVSLCASVVHVALGEPLHGAARDVREAFAVSSSAVSWPGMTRAFLLTPTSLFNGEWSLTVSVTPSPDRESVKVTPIRHESSGAPVATWGYNQDDVAWLFSAAALPVGGTNDSLLLASFEVTARNVGRQIAEASIGFDLRAGDSARIFTSFDAGRGTTADTLSYGWAETASQTASVPRTLVLKPGASKSIRVIMPSYPLSQAELNRWSRHSHKSFIASNRRYWRAELARGLSLELGDATVEAAFRSAVVVLLSCRERRGDVWVPIGGPFHYRDVWLRDGARAIYALAIAGYTGESRELAKGLLRYQWPEGFLISQRGQLDGTGQALWALEQALLRGIDRQVEPAVAEAVLRAWRWCERSRASSSALGMRSGLLPFGDPKDNEAVQAQLVGNDLWAYAGYVAGARLLVRAGRNAEAESLSATARDYRSVIVQTLIEGESDDVPATWQGCGLDWGNLTGTFPSGVLQPWDDRMHRLARRMRSASDYPGLSAYGPSDSVHYYLGADLGMWALLAHERNIGDEVLDAMLYWRTASGGAPELFSNATRDFGENVPPHATGAAALITLIRNAVVCDVDDTLRLTLGARRLWWRGSAVKHVPTRWGNVDVQFQSKSHYASWTWTAVDAWTELTIPPNTSIAWIPSTCRSHGQYSVLVPPGIGYVKIGVEYNAE